MKAKPLFWKSIHTGKEYPYEAYSTHETPRYGKLPLPKEGYPYTVIFQKNGYTDAIPVNQTNTDVTETEAWKLKAIKENGK